MSAANERVQAEIDYAGVAVSFVLPSRDDHISKILLNERSFYEIGMLEALAPALKEGDLVIDAGANIGNHTLFFAKILKCRVLAFEAFPATAKLLAENVNANGLADRVQVHQVALGERSGTAKVVAYDESNVGGTTLRSDRRGSIPIIPLDKLDIDGTVRLLKIDVEGMDLAVLKGAKNLLEKHRPWVVCEAGNNAAYQSIRGFMECAGYTPTAVYNATDTFLFLPSRSEEERRVLIDRAFAQMMTMQHDERQIAARLAQAGRYSERMKSEALAEVQERLEAWDKQHAELEQGGDVRKTPALENQLAAQSALQHELSAAVARGKQAELEQQKSLRQLAGVERQREAKVAELADARAALQAERDQAAAQLGDAQARADEGRKEIAVLLERVAQAKQVLEQQRASLAHLTAVVARERAEHETQTTELRVSAQQATDAAKLATEASDERARLLSNQLAELESLLTKSNGLLARKERELGDKQRRVIDAHRVLRIRAQRISELELSLEARQRSLAAANEELNCLRASTSFKLGVLVVDSMRSPLRFLALFWTVPALLWREWRRRNSGN